MGLIKTRPPTYVFLPLLGNTIVAPLAAEIWRPRHHPLGPCALFAYKTDPLSGVPVMRNTPEAEIPTTLNSTFQESLPFSFRRGDIMHQLQHYKLLKCFTVNLNGANRKIHLPKQPTSLIRRSNQHNARLSQWSSNILCSK